MLKTVVLLNIFLEIMINVFLQNSLMNKMFKEHHLFKKKIYIYIEKIIV